MIGIVSDSVPGVSACHLKVGGETDLSASKECSATSEEQSARIEKDASLTPYYIAWACSFGDLRGRGHSVKVALIMERNC
jgi:hypothetical protein